MKKLDVLNVNLKKKIALVTTPILIGSLTLTSYQKENNNLINIIDDNTLIDEDVNELETIDNNIVIQDESEIISIKTETEIPEVTYLNDAINIINNIPVYTEVDDDFLNLEAKDDNVTLYIIGLQTINNSNILRDINIQDFARYNKKILYSNDRTNIYLLSYEAASYKRLIDNKIDILDVMDELDTLLSYQAMNVYNYYNPEDFPNLCKTLSENENLFDIYLPLAYDIHRITCPNKHTDINKIDECPKMQEKFDLKIYIKNQKENTL